MQYINLTPHAINVQKLDGTMMEIPPSGKVARVEQESRQLFVTREDVAIYATSYGEVTGLPSKPAGETWLIVSAIVRLAVPGRKDVLSPGEQIRNEAGRVIGCNGLLGNP